MKITNFSTFHYRSKTNDGDYFDEITYYFDESTWEKDCDYEILCYFCSRTRREDVSDKNAVPKHDDEDDKHVDNEECKVDNGRTVSLLTINTMMRMIKMRTIRNR